MLFWNKEEFRGHRYIIGIDEVGRGSLAGPVAVGAVLLDVQRPVEKNHPLITDSKELTNLQKSVADKWIRTNLTYVVVEKSAEIVDKNGINSAIELAVKDCLQILKYDKQLDYLVLFDGDRPLTELGITDGKGNPKKHYECIVKGDSKCFSIACASIVAKVQRDTLLTKLGKLYPAYNWLKNDGYYDEEHKRALQLYGFTKYHRRSFIHFNVAEPNTDEWDELDA